MDMINKIRKERKERKCPCNNECGGCYSHLGYSSIIFQFSFVCFRWKFSCKSVAECLQRVWITQCEYNVHKSRIVTSFPALPVDDKLNRGRVPRTRIFHRALYRICLSDPCLFLSLFLPLRFALRSIVFALSALSDFNFALGRQLILR